MNYARPVLLVLAAAIAVGCSERPEQQEPASGAPEAEVAAMVNGEPISMAALRLYSINSLNKEEASLTPEERRAVVDDLVDYALLTQAAKKAGLLEERRFAAELELQRLQTVGAAMAQRHLQANVPTESELKAIYDENAAALNTTEFKLRHIVVPEEAAANDIIKKLDGGAKFETLANERSPTSNGGDLGWITRDSLLSPIRELVESLEAGRYSKEPVKTDFGYHVILLEEKRAVEAPAMDTLRDQLIRASQSLKLDAYVKSLRSDAVIDVSRATTP